jgi:hypothetical protein
MARPKEHFNFDAFMNKIETALLLAQKTAVLAGGKDAERVKKTANTTLVKLREIREMIDQPLVWFKMEKGLRYQKNPGENWKPAE